jgi:hypothetical protein
MERDQIVGYLSAMTDTEFAALTSEARAQPPLSPLQQARAEGRAKTGRLLELRAQSDARATDRATVSLAGSSTDQAAAAQAEAEAAWAAAAQAEAAPQGLTPNRGQGAGGSGAPPPAGPQTGQQKAGQLHDLHRNQRQNGI